MMRRSLWMVLLTFAACENTTRGDENEIGGGKSLDQQSGRGEVIKAPRYQQAIATPGPAGTDCTRTGPAGCLSGLCVKQGLERLASRACVNRCEQDEDCGGNEHCVQLSAVDNLWACLPDGPVGATEQSKAGAQ